MIESLSGTKLLSPRLRAAKAFTLVELMVSMTIIVLLMVMLVQMTNSTSQLWRRTTGKVEQFRAAREGFESMTRQLGQATLNTYWDYNDANNPTKFVRQSELRFASGPIMTGTKPLNSSPSGAQQWPFHGVFFFAPSGYDIASKTTTDPLNDTSLSTLLNVCGYYVEFNTDHAYAPQFLQNVITDRYRFRLMEMKAASRDVNIYSHTSSATSPVNLTYQQKDWFTPYMVNPGVGMRTSFAALPVRILAENVVALIILPRLSSQEELSRKTNGKKPLCPDYHYDTTYDRSNSAYPYSDPETNPTNQLPPVVQVVMVAIDEPSALRWAAINGTTMPSLGSSDLFADSTKLFDLNGNPDKGDLAVFEQYLTQQKLTYRVFSSAVAIKAAKWSRQQVESGS